MAIMRNLYIGRTFIKPYQTLRFFEASLKYSVIKELVENKRIVLIDDSIVRGTTSKVISSILRANGVKEIHLRICSPPIIYPCFYGIDIPKRSELIAFNKNIDEIAKELRVDSLKYLTIDNLREVAKLTNMSFCTACFTGEYPTKIDSKFDKFQFEKRIFQLAI